MKKILVLFAVMAVMLSGLYANGRGEMTTVEGTLGVRDSVPFVDTEDGQWLLPPGAFYRAAWENKISTGDRLVIQGYADTEPRFAPEGFSGRIMPVSVTVNGKELELDGTFGPGQRRTGRGGYEWCGPSDGRRFRDGERFGSSERSGNRGRNR